MKLGSLILSLGLLCASQLAVAAVPDSCPLNAFGGDERGRGGGDLVCRDSRGRITSVELFDYWEQRTERDIYNAAPDASNPVEFAKKALKLVRRYFPQRAQAYEKFIDRFMEQAQWTDSELSPIHDTCSDLQPPPGCRYDQLIHRRAQVSVPEDRLFLINRPLWNSMIIPYQGGRSCMKRFTTKRSGRVTPIPAWFVISTSSCIRIMPNRLPIAISFSASSMRAFRFGSFARRTSRV